MIKFWLPFNKDGRNIGLSTTSATSYQSLTMVDGGGPNGCTCGQGRMVFHMTEDEFDNEFTVAVWCNYTSSWGSTNHIICCKNTGDDTSNTHWYFSIYGGTSLAIGINGSAAAKKHSYTFQPNTWYHLAVTFNGNTYRLYVNGSEIGSGQFTTAKVTGNLNIGLGCRSKNNQGTTASGSDTWKLSDFRIYNNELKANEIKELASKKIFDVRGSSMITNAVDDLGGTGTILTPINVAKSGNTFYFNGTDAYIITSDLDFMKMVDSDYTFSLWIYSQEADSSRSIYFGCGNQGNGWTFALEKQASTNKFRIYNNGSPDWYVDGCIISPNQWIHVAVVRSGGTVTVYKNGVSVGTKTGFTNHSAFDKIYYLGSDYRTGDTRFKGYLGDFKAYSTALSANEVMEIYSKGLILEASESAFVPIKCLRFTGQQYLNLGTITANTKVAIELDFTPDNLAHSQPTFIGVKGKTFQAYRGGTTTISLWWKSGGSYGMGTFNAEASNKLIMTFTSSQFTYSLNGASTTNSNTELYPMIKGGDLILGGYNTGTSYPFFGDVHALKISCDDVLWKDLIPAVTDDCRVGFYDKKNEIWYFSQTANGFDIVM